MKRKELALLLLAGAVVGAGLGAEPASRPSLGGTKSTAPVETPKSLEAEMTRAQKELDQIADRLSSIAEDNKRPWAERTESFVLLAKIGTPKSYDFLVSKAAFFLPTREQHLMFPAAHALRSSGDWRAAQAILRSMDEPKTREELIQLYSALRVIMGDSAIARALVEAKLQYNLPNVRRANLEQLKEFLSH